MAHISDDVPALLTGDASREVVLAAAGHLRECVDCQQELVSAVIAHASLTSAQRFAPEIVTVADLPDLTKLFDEVKAEASAPVALPTRRVRRRLAAVAVAAVVAGGGVTAYALTSGSNEPAGRTVALTGTAVSGSVRLADDSWMSVSTQLPAPAAGHQYEVWLTGSDGGKQAVGYLRGGAAEIAVPDDVMQKYKGIAVSVQRSGQSEFSGKVVLAGQYG